MVVEPGLPAWQDIVSYFGKEILQENQEIDRAKLAKIVFNDEEKRKQLEHFVHSRMGEEIGRQQKAALEADLNAVIIHDVPLLFEVGVDKTVQKTIVVYACEENQVKRLMQRDGLSEVDIKSRIRAQMPLAEKMNRADYVINNDGSVEETKRQVEQLYQELCALARAKK
jgi:dephospho-CoA kinase